MILKRLSCLFFTLLMVSSCLCPMNCSTAQTPDAVAPAAPSGLTLAGSATPTPDTSAPSVSGVIGTVSQGQLISISGSGFGSRSTGGGEIVDFINGSISSAWKWSSTFILSYDGSSAAIRHQNSTGAAWANFNSSHSQLNANLENPYVSRKWFASYWFKLGSNWDFARYNQVDDLHNVKWIRFLESNESSYQGSYTDASYAGSGCVNAYVTENLNCPFPGSADCIAGMPGGWFQGDVLSDWTLNQWHHIEVEFADSDIDSPNGVLRIWSDGERVLNDTRLLTRASAAQNGLPSDRFSYVWLGFYSTFGNGQSGNNDFWLDDGVASPTWARVMIGNASTFGACTHREYQVVQSWGGSLITARVNTGSLGAGTRYLFVVTEDGLTSNGYALTLQ